MDDERIKHILTELETKATGVLTNNNPQEVMATIRTQPTCGILCR